LEAWRESVVPDMQGARLQEQQGPRLPTLELAADVADRCGFDMLAVDINMDGLAQAASLDQDCVGSDSPADQQQIVDMDRI